MTEPEASCATHTAVVVGGPLGGQEVVSRFEGGFLLVDKPGGQCWLYDGTDDEWVLREGYPQPWDRDRSWTAADGPDYDVLALP